MEIKATKKNVQVTSKARVVTGEGAFEDMKRIDAAAAAKKNKPLGRRQAPQPRQSPSQPQAQPLKLESSGSESPLQRATTALPRRPGRL